MRHFSSSYELKISLTQYRYALIHNEYVALNFWCDWFNKHHSALWSFYSLTHNNVRVSFFQLFIETSLWWLSNYNLKLSCCALNILCTYVWEVQSIKSKIFPWGALTASWKQKITDHSKNGFFDHCIPNIYVPIVCTCLVRNGIKEGIRN